MGKYSFGEYNSKIKLEALNKNFEIFCSNEPDISIALNLCLDAWHLIEFVLNEYKTDLLLNDLASFRSELYKECEYFKIIHDLANASKHGGVLSNPKAKIEYTDKHNGDFSNDFSNDFDTSYLEIILENNTKLDFFLVIENIINFWNKFFKEKLEINIK